MTNVLPDAEKKTIVRALRARTISVVALLLFYIATIGSVALFPSYLLVRVKEKNIQNELTAIRAEDFTQESEALRLVVQDINTKLRVFQNTETVVPSALLIEPLLLQSYEGITITSFRAEKNDTSTAVTLEGQAALRSNLLSFVESLKKNTNFTGIELPISGLVKDRAIPFNLNFNVGVH